MGLTLRTGLTSAAAPGYWNRSTPSGGFERHLRRVTTAEQTHLPEGDGSSAILRSNELFRLAFEHSSNAMLLTTPERLVLAANPAFVRMMGQFNPPLAGLRADRLVAPRCLDRLEPDWETLLQTGHVTSHRTWMTAEQREVDVQFAAARAELGGVDAVLLVVLDAGLGTMAPAPAAGEPDERTLTPREQEVISHIAMGLRVPEIAAQLFISPSTVRTHVRNAMGKLDARSQAQLVAIALIRHLVDPHHVRANRDGSSPDGRSVDGGSAHGSSVDGGSPDGRSADGGSPGGSSAPG